MKQRLLIILLFVGPHRSVAQLNESDSLPLRVKLTTTGSYLDGIVNRLLLINRAEIGYAQPAWGFSSRQDYQYGRTFYRQTENDVLSYNFLYLTPLRRCYPYAMLLLETNYRRRLTFRYQPGLGVSYNLIQRANNGVKLSLTGSYERSEYGGTNFENYESTRQLANVIETVRATGRVFGRHQLFANKLRLLYEFWFQQSILEAPNYRYHTDDALEFPLNRHVAVRAGFRYSYEHIQLAGNKPYDLFLTYGISVGNF